ncbi:MAG: hypothetical protein IKP90_01845 [Fibrobacter sp.]|nr:hypothetical protein [Fibrobacter sp.]
MNYFEMSRKFICSVAMPLALMLAACSDDKSVAGGSAEETGVYAFENVSVRGVAMINAQSETQDSSKMELPEVGMQKGSVVTLYELDSVTLERTGVSFADTLDTDNGAFNIRDVKLSSPYVWITAVEKEGLSVDADYVMGPLGGTFLVNAFVDVRDTAPVTVDIFSDLMSFRVRTLMLAGSSFQEASAKAKSEILEAFGISGDSADGEELTELDYYAMRSVFVGVMRFSFSTKDDSLERIDASEIFGQYGSLLNVKSNVLVGVHYALEDLKFRLSIPQAVYDQMGEVAAKEYRAMLLYEKYLAGILSVLLEAGPCVTDSDAMVDVPSEDVGIVCRSGGWHLAFEQVPHTFGTMTDARDGRTYRTVTIDIDGVEQTWMAENLNYSGTEFGASKCLNDKEENCGIYGRTYDWNVAMGLGESVLRNAYGSMQECVDSLSARFKVSSDSSDEASLKALDAEIQERCEVSMSDSSRIVDFSVIDLDSIAVTQGVCPDGWRIPTFDDWETIFSYVDRTWHSAVETAYLLAAPSIGDPFGFSLYNTVEMEWDGDRTLKTEVILAKYIMVPKENGRLHYFGDLNTVASYDLGYVFNYNAVSFEGWRENFFVRCVKN